MTGQDNNNENNNQQPQNFNQPPQNYNQPPQNFNQPPQYNNQPPQYNQPPQNYNQPPQYNQTNQGYNQPPYQQGQPQYQGQVPQQQQGMYIDPNNMQPLLDQIKKQMNVVQDPMYVLSESNICYVRQQPCMMELVSGCDTQNIYDVYCKSKDGEVLMLFKGKEYSGCCERQFCRGDSRPFKMHLKHVKNNNVMDPDMMEDFAIFDRPFKCTCYCFERPKMKGYYKSENGVMFGSITEPWTCCDPMMVVKDMNKEPQFMIHADCCQCGLMCKNSCGFCSDVKLQIYPASNTSYEPSNAIGSITKTFAGMLQEMMTDADNYEIRFPPNASAEEKLLIIGATLMIDYRYFEDTTNDQKKRQRKRMGF